MNDGCYTERLEEVKDYLRGMLLLNGDPMRVTEEQIEKDAKELIEQFIKEDPEWLNKPW